MSKSELPKSRTAFEELQFTYLSKLFIVGSVRKLNFPVIKPII